MATDQRARNTNTGKSTRKRRGEIVDAAAKVFAERGYHGTSTQDIADLLGMRQASLYYYFPSKEAALEEVCAYGTADYVEKARAIADSEDRAINKLEALLLAHVAPLVDRPNYTLTFLNERKWLPKESRRRVGELSRQMEIIFEGVIEEGMQTGEFRLDLDARLVALGLLGMMNSVASWHDREAKSIEEIASALTLAALSGIKKR